MAKRLNLKGIELGRTIGIEVEGYTKDFRNMADKGVRHSELKRDASLGNSYGWGVNYNSSVGVEVVSNPLSKLDMLDDIFKDIQGFKWNVGRGKAGTHVHVDIRDYKLIDQLKMAIFMQRLDEVMFLMVKPSRYSRNQHGSRNRYCAPLDRTWSNFLDRVAENGLKVENYTSITDLIFAVAEKERQGGQYRRFPNYNRYNFANVFNTGKGTIEFRLFHAIRDSKDAKKFGLIAYNIIETVKHSTLEQLNFIADSVNNSSSAEEMVEKFATSIGLEFTPKIFNNELKGNINRRKTREVAVS